MINPFLVCGFWISAGLFQSVSVQPLEAESARPIMHLHSFFDARSLSPGHPVYLSPVNIEPSEVLIAAKDPLRTVVAGDSIERIKPSQSPPARALTSMTAAEASPTSPKSTGEVTVNLNFVNTSFDLILDEIMKQTGANLLLLAEPKNITYRVKDRRLSEALADICAIANLSSLKVGNEYVIAADDKLKNAYPVEYGAAHPTIKKVQPDVITFSYKTNYCDANKLLDALSKEFKPEELTMIAAPSQSNPTLSDQDQSTKSGVSSTVMDQDAQSNKVSRVLVLRGPRETVDAALDLIKGIDLEPAQVNIAVTINDLSLDAERDLGIDWTTPQVTFTENQPNGIGFTSVTRSPLTFQATLNALETKGLDKLLASPNISVLDGQRAYILVGQRLEFPIIQSYNQNGTPIFNIDEERVGIYLQVSVWVTNDGKVKLNLYPQVSSVTSYINVNGGNYPQISTREAQTTLTIESGHTIVIGGLIHDEDIVNFQKVPILSQIPLFGELFTSRSKSKTKDEVIITITPTIAQK